MEGTLKAIEVTGTVDDQLRLHLDEPLPLEKAGRVRVIILIPEETDEEREWLRAAAANPAFGFLNDAEEVVYSADDGRPFVDQG